MRLIVLAAAPLLAACSAAPEIDVSRFEGRLPPPPRGTPALLPPEVGPARTTAPAVEAGARAAALRARAAALMGPVIPPTERERLAGARRP